MKWFRMDLLLIVGEAQPLGDDLDGFLRVGDRPVRGLGHLREFRST